MSWLSRWRSKATGELAAWEVREPVASLLTDPGCHRPQNEDSARIVRAGAGPFGDRGLLLVVADGMGGHEAGEVASQAAVEMIEKEYRDARGTPGEALETAFRRAHSEILRLASADNALTGMGTTCTALAIVGVRAWAAHVGDSRLYLLRGDRIYQLTEDHTQCMELVRKGLMTLEEARHHDDRNVLARAMGTRRELAIQTWKEPMPVRPGDAFLLCSDGLHDLVTSTEIREIARDGSPETACRRLVDLARDRGGYDNVTVAIAAIPARGHELAVVKTTRLREVDK